MMDETQLDDLKRHVDGGEPPTLREYLMLLDEVDTLRGWLKEIVDAYGMGSTPEAFCRHIEEPIMAARATLSTSVEPESSGDDPEVARHEGIIKEAWRFWASIQGDPVVLDRGYRILRVHPDRYAAFDALFRSGARPMDQPAATPHDDARE